VSGTFLAIAGALAAAGGVGGLGWWLGYGQGFQAALLGSEPVPKAEEPREVGFGLQVLDDVEGIEQVGRRPA
jgi:hypothetical protein